MWAFTVPVVLNSALLSLRCAGSVQMFHNVVLNSTLLSLRCAGSVQMFHDVSIHIITWKNLYHVDEGVNCDCSD